MLHRYFFLLLLLYFPPKLLCQESIAQNKREKSYLKSAPFYEVKVSENIHSKRNEELNKQSSSTKEKNIFSQEDIEEMELVFESSPEKAQDIVRYLQDSNYFSGNIDLRASFFVGDPGSGKTMMAKAIAYKMAQKGWKYKIIPSTSFFGEYRNQTAIQLKKELDSIALSNKPTILVIDELHRILENSNSKHHDTDATSTVLWTFLDDQKHNKNFFLIGTMNRANKLPKPFKDRMLSGYIPFPLINDSQTKIRLLRKNLITTNTYLDEEVNDTFLDKELERLGPCSGRNLKLLSQNILMMHKGNKEKRPLQIKKELITRGINEYLCHKAHMEYDMEDETDEERQERHHKENMALQKKHQSKSHEIQQKHFILQQRMQLALAQYQHVLSTPGIIDLAVNRTEECQREIISIFADMQKISTEI